MFTVQARTHAGRHAVLFSTLPAIDGFLLFIELSLHGSFLYTFKFVKF